MTPYSKAFQIFGISAVLHAASALRITSPKDRVVVNPGQTIQVEVSATGVSFVGVALTAPYPIKCAETVLTTPPYRFSVTVPAGARPRVYRIWALSGTVADGEIHSDPIDIDVERSDLPTVMTVDVGSGMSLSVGEESGIRVFGVYADGSHLDLTESTKTKYEAVPPGIASISSGGSITGLKVGSAEIVINKQVFVKVAVGPRS